MRNIQSFCTLLIPLILILPIPSNSQSIITSGITSNYEIVQSSASFKTQISQLFPAGYSSELFKILEKSGEISFNYGMLSAKLNPNEDLTNISLDLKVVEVYGGLKGSNRFIGLSGNFGAVDIEVEIEFDPGLQAITGSTVAFPENQKFSLKVFNRVNKRLIYQVEGGGDVTDAKPIKWVNNSRSIPSSLKLSDKFFEQNRNLYQGNPGNIHLLESYIQLNYPPQFGMLLIVEAEFPQEVQGGINQRFQFYAYQKKNLDNFSTNIEDWVISTPMSDLGKYSNSTFYPSREGDLLLTYSQDGQRGSWTKVFTIWKFNLIKESGWIIPEAIYSKEFNADMKYDVTFEILASNRNIKCIETHYSFEDYSRSIKNSKSRIIQYFLDYNGTLIEPLNLD
ncbi:hypothetical protein [Robiginitalea sp. IMCC43444]|uniref:hypothetical protein n=1 Tax=Robiginitalea sp. IMCC43444 TaxID=3459121 RepID=UPI004042BE1E